MNAIAYIRVSTDEQTQSGAGLAAQRDACAHYAHRHHSGLTAVFADEGVSGATGLDKRPALLKAISGLGKGDTLVVAKRDRLGRDPIIVAMIESAVARKGARIVSAAGEGTEGDDPSSVLMRRMIDAFAEYERLVIKARTKAALQSKKSRGERVGSIPYGYLLGADGGSLEPNPVEQAAIKQVTDLKANGLSHRQIARRLEDSGYRPRGGKAWHPQTIANILKAAA